MKTQRPLSDDQMEHFRTFGFLAFPGLLADCVDRIHGEAMVRTAGPERMVHLQQVRENDTHLGELARELRKKMKEPSRG